MQLIDLGVDPRERAVVVDGVGVVHVGVILGRSRRWRCRHSEVDEVEVVGESEMMCTRAECTERKGESRAPWSAARALSLRRSPVRQAPT